VRESEGRDRTQQPRPPGHEEQQCQHEQQMVDTQQDVLHTEFQVRARHRGPLGSAADRERRLVGREPHGLRGAVRALHPREHIRAGHGKTFDRDATPDEPTLARGAPALHMAPAHGTRRVLGAVAGGRETHLEAQPQLPLRRDLEEHVPGRRVDLAKLEVAGPDLVRGGRAREADEQCEARDERGPGTPTRHGCSSSDSAPGATGIRTSTS
jgi:hypothetical protein